MTPADPGYVQRVRDSFARQAAGGNEQDLVATMTATVMTVRGRENIRH